MKTRDINNIEFANFLKGDLLDLTNLQVILGRWGLQEARQIINFLKFHPDITGLDLSGHYINYRFAEKLAEKSNELTTLYLNNCSIDNKSAIALSKNLKMTSLYLSHNDISDTGAIALLSNPKLKKLDLSWNKIPMDGLEALISNTTLLELDISNNLIRDKGTSAKIFANLTVKKLNISDNIIGDETAEALAICGTNLVELNLSNNMITNKSLNALLNNKSLTKLEIHDMTYREEFPYPKSLFSNMHLLDLSHNAEGKIGKWFDELINENRSTRKSVIVNYLNQQFPTVLILIIAGYMAEQCVQIQNNEMKTLIAERDKHSVSALLQSREITAKHFYSKTVEEPVCKKFKLNNYG